MIISINGFENKIELKEDKVSVLEIEDKKLFNKIIQTLNLKTKGELKEDNEILLKDNEEVLDIEKNMIIVFDLFNIEYNNKKYLSKIYEKISSNIKNSEEYKIEKLILALRNYLITEVNELEFEFSMKDDLAIQDILKLFQVKIDEELYDTTLEKLEFLIELISTLGIAKILIIPNLKSYVDKEEVLELYKYSIYNNIKLLIIESNKQEDLLKYENKIIIDKNFCDFKVD